MLILLSLPEARLDFTIKCVLLSALHVYIGKIVESVFPFLVITFPLTFVFCTLIRQFLLTKYSHIILSHTEQRYYNKKYVSSTFDTLNIQISLAAVSFSAYLIQRNTITYITTM